jgi:tetratricopeptide (TPR) repeat protein
MTVGQSLSRLALRRLVEDVQTTGGPDVAVSFAAFLARHGRDRRQLLLVILGQALDRACWVLEIALTEDSFWNQGQLHLAPGEALAFRQHIELFLSGVLSSESPDVPVPIDGAYRRQCLWELRAAREADVFTTGLHAEELARLAEIFSACRDDEWLAGADRHSAAGLVQGLEQHNCPGLAQLLVPERAAPLLARLVCAFASQTLAGLIRHYLQDNPEDAPAHGALVLNALRSLHSPRLAQWRPPPPAQEQPVETTPTVVDPAPPSPTALFWEPPTLFPGVLQPAAPPTPPRRIERSAVPRRTPHRKKTGSPAHSSDPLPNRQPVARRSRTARSSSSGFGQVGPAALCALATGVLLGVALFAWLLSTGGRSGREAERQVALKRQRLDEERHRLQMEVQRQVEERRRAAEQQAAQKQQEERQRLVAEQRQKEHERELREKAEQEAAERERQQRLRQEEERRARLEAEKERRARASVLLEQGLTHFAFRRDREALDAFNEVLQLQPDCARAYRERGRVRHRLHDDSGALGDFSEAIRREPQDAVSWFGRAAIHVEHQEDSSAISDFTEVLRLEPENVRAYQQRGLCHSRKHDLVQAIADESAAIRLAPDDPWSYFYRGEAHRLHNEPERALADYNEAIRRNSSGDTALAGAYRARGALWLEREHYRDAIADYTQALRGDPADVASYHARGAAYLKVADWEAAALDFGAVLDRDPRDVLAYKSRGLAYLSMGDYRLADADFSRAIDLHRADGEVFYLRARMRLQLGDVQDAIFDCNDAIARKRGFAAAYQLRGQLYFQQGDRSRGMEDQRIAGEIDPSLRLH